MMWEEKVEGCWSPVSMEMSRDSLRALAVLPFGARELHFQ